MNIGPNTLKKEERLKNPIIIGDLFKKGLAKSFFPFRAFFLKTQFSSSSPVRFAVSVPKRNFPRAVDRNRIKRQIREAYRLQKDHFLKQLNGQDTYAIMFVYISKEQATYQQIEKNVAKCLKHISNH